MVPPLLTLVAVPLAEPPGPDAVAEADTVTPEVVSVTAAVDVGEETD